MEPDEKEQVEPKEEEKKEEEKKPEIPKPGETLEVNVSDTVGVGEAVAPPPDEKEASE